MANMAMATYAIEGPPKDLEEILGAICLAIKDTDEHKYEEYIACLKLGFPKSQLRNFRLGGEISEEPTLENGVLKFWAEERWGLQDFDDVLKLKFPDIKVFWQVEEFGNCVFCTNDTEGKYFPDRWYCELCQDDFCDMEYFIKEESMYKWLSEKTNGRVHDAESVEKFNADYEETGDDCENYIIIHECDIVY